MIYRRSRACRAVRRLEKNRNETVERRGKRGGKLAKIIKSRLYYTKKTNDAKGAEAFASFFLRFFVVGRAAVSVFDGFAFAAANVFNAL